MSALFFNQVQCKQLLESLFILHKNVLRIRVEPLVFAFEVAALVVLEETDVAWSPVCDYIVDVLKGITRVTIGWLDSESKIHRFFVAPEIFLARSRVFTQNFIFLGFHELPLLFCKQRK